MTTTPLGHTSQPITADLYRHELPAPAAQRRPTVWSLLRLLAGAGIGRSHGMAERSFTK
jgi:hypothetical protein